MMIKDIFFLVLVLEDFVGLDSGLLQAELGEFQKGP